MTTRSSFALLAACVFTFAAGLAGCGSDDPPYDGASNGTEPAEELAAGGGNNVGAPAVGGGPGGGDSGTVLDNVFADPAFESLSCTGGTLVAGLNEGFKAGGKSRSLYVDFPKDTSKPMAVLFKWHGFQDSAEAFRKNVPFEPDGDPAVPTIIVTPDDLGELPPVGLDWNISNGAADKNADLQFFQEMVACLNAQQKLDKTRIYLFGFSAGAVFTNLLHARYPKLFAAIISESGAWMNDEKQRALVNIPLVKITWTWPDLNSADRGNVLMAHGGEKDVAALGVLDLEKAGQATVPFLEVAQRTVIDCPHQDGHALHQQLLIPVMQKYLSAHRNGLPSPYTGGTIEGFPEGCTLNLP